MKQLIYILIYLMPICSYTQNWPKVYGHYSNNGELYQIYETYDRGYLLCGNYTNYLDKTIGWIVKTDINGNILWEKKIGDYSYFTHTFCARETNDRGWILTGRTSQFDPATDPYVLKLDSCGNKQWCNIYKTPGNMDWANEAYDLEEGGYICLMSFYSDNLNKKIWLFRLDEDGNTLWSNYYHQDTNYILAQGFNMILTTDSCYLITGWNSTEVVPGSGLYWISPFWIKVDINGEEVWEATWHESDFLHGYINESVENNNGYYIGAGNNGVNPPSNLCLYKLNIDGTPFQRVDILPNTLGADYSTIDFLQDSTLVLAGAYGFDPDTGSYSIIHIADTAGLLLHEHILPVDDGLPPNSLFVTHDNKIVATIVRVSTVPVHFETCLFKFNSELEYDSIYTMPMAYDTVCSSPIASDTIPLDCWPVDVDEPQVIMTTDNLQIDPNPARTSATVTIPETFSTSTQRNGLTTTKVRSTRNLEMTLSVFTQQGQRSAEISIPKNETILKIDVTEWADGIYFLTLTGNSKVIAKEKLVVIK